ncbi:MAG: hypothetical protein MUO23_03200 [Anaerolineales bacterium]|nr:hypothetical protein [Anaerolineales bacterium]
MQAVPDRFWRAFGWQCLGWGAVDPPVAGLGISRVTRAHPVSAPEHACRLKRLLVASGALDAVYLTDTLLLLRSGRRRRSPVRAGSGVWVLRQAMSHFEIPASLIDQLLLTGRGQYRATPDLETPALTVQALNDPLITRRRTRGLLRRFRVPLEDVKVPGSCDRLHLSSPGTEQVMRAALGLARSLLAARLA